MCGSDEPHLYPVWNFTYRTKQVRANEVEASWNVMAHAQKPDFVFRRNGRVRLNRREASVQSTTGSRGVLISGSNAGYAMFWGSVKSTGYPLHSWVSPSLLLCVTMCHHISTGVYRWRSCISYSSTLPMCLQGMDSDNITFTLKYARQSRNIYCNCYTPGVD